MGGIIIVSHTNVGFINSTYDLYIHRLPSGGTGMVTIYSKVIQSIYDLEFSLVDILAKSGTEYDYFVELKSGDQIVESDVFSSVLFNFEGLLISDFNKYYVAGLNFKTENVKKNRSVEYVTTLSGRCPFQVINAANNYYTGTSSGLFLKLSENGKQFEPDSYHEYFKEVMEFLCNGSPKVLKTHDGIMLYVAIDDSPNEIYSDFWGMNAIQFNWTEIGDLPESVVVEVEHK